MGVVGNTLEREYFVGREKFVKEEKEEGERERERERDLSAKKSFRGPKQKQVSEWIRKLANGRARIIRVSHRSRSNEPPHLQGGGNSRMEGRRKEGGR